MAPYSLCYNVTLESCEVFIYELVGSVVSIVGGFVERWHTEVVWSTHVEFHFVFFLERYGPGQHMLRCIYELAFLGGVWSTNVEIHFECSRF